MGKLRHRRAVLLMPAQLAGIRSTIQPRSPQETETGWGIMTSTVGLIHLFSIPAHLDLVPSRHRDVEIETLICLPRRHKGDR